MATNPIHNRRVTNLNRHPQQHHPSRYVPDMPMPVTHYALDLEAPPLIACEAPDSPPSSTNPMDVTCPDCMTHEQFPQSVARMREDRPIIRDAEDAPPIVRAYDVLTTAALLLSDSSENGEYDRAIVELTATLIGATPDDYPLLTRILRSLKQGA